jgi:hypothetical protein
MEYLRDRGYAPYVTLSLREADDGDDMIDLKPTTRGAAEVLVRIRGDSLDDYDLCLFVDGSGEGVEIAGPINKNHPPPHRPAGEELVYYLDVIAGGRAYLEPADDGQVPRANVPAIWIPDAAQQVDPAWPRFRPWT